MLFYNTGNGEIFQLKLLLRETGSSTHIATLKKKDALPYEKLADSSKSLESRKRQIRKFAESLLTALLNVRQNCWSYEVFLYWRVVVWSRWLAPFDAYTLKVNKLLIGNTYKLFCVIFIHEKYIQFRIWSYLVYMVFSRIAISFVPM